MAIDPIFGKQRHQGNRSRRENSQSNGPTSQVLVIVERLAVLEERVRHMEDDMSSMSSKVDEMHAILLQARGAKWAIVAIAGAAGFASGIVTKFLPFMR